MKATINAAGVLQVEAETGIEAFALNKWSQDAFRCIVPMRDAGLGSETGVFRGSRMAVYYDDSKVDAPLTTREQP